MRTRILKKLRDKWVIVGSTIHVIKYVYSVKPLSRHPRGCPEDAEWFTYSYESAVLKQREMILSDLISVKNSWWCKFAIKHF